MKKVPYEEINLSIEPERRLEMLNASGKTIIPQIFVNDKPFGGLNELQELLDSGDFDLIFRPQQQ